MLLNDKDIRKYCTLRTFYGSHPMIDPFTEKVAGYRMQGKH